MNKNKEEEEKRKIFPPSSSRNINYKNLMYNNKVCIVDSYKEIIKKLDFVLEEQKRICPPTSYSNGSTNNIVMNSCEQYGQIIIIFSKFKNTFDKIFVCEQDEQIIEKIKNNLNEYNLLNHVIFLKKNLMNFLKYDYLNETPRTIVFYNSTNDNYSVNDYLNYLKSNSIPLFFVNNSNENTSEIKHLIKSIKNENLNLIHYSIENNKLINQSNHLLSVQCNFQFKELFLFKNLKDKLFKFLKSKLNCNIKLTNECFYLIKNNLNKGDDKIYESLFKLIHSQQNINKYEQKEEKKEEKRKNYRVQEIEDILNFNKIKLNINGSMLDFGCADGEITRELGNNLNFKNIYGCDIRKIIKKDDFNFILLNENSKQLPFENNEFSIIFCLMSLHHIKNLDENLNEIYRILKPGSYLFIREHDSNEKNFNIFLDIVHGLYALVLSNPQEWPDFLDTYYATYFSQKEWSSKLKDLGFIQLLDNYSKPSNINWYYSIFQKPEDDSKKRKFDEMK
eukprot:gene3445-6094_t